MSVARAALETLLVAAIGCGSAAPTDALEWSTDVPARLGGTEVGTADATVENTAGVFVLPSALELPPGANLTAITRGPSGERYLAFDAAIAFGRAVARRGDLIVESESGFDVVFRARDHTDDAVGIDGAAWTTSGDLWLSFDVPAEVGGLRVADEDVFSFDPETGAFAMVFDGSAEGLRDSFDVDAIDEGSAGELVFSVDVSGIVDGIAFDDDDVLSFDFATGRFDRVYRGSSRSAGWEAADLDAFELDDAPDADGDGRPDVIDNCPFEPNPDQLDRGGIGGGSAPDGIGDACQCGDVSGNGVVTTADSLIIRRSLLEPPTATMTRPELCNVGGSRECSTADAAIVRRALLEPPTATIGTLCAGQASVIP